MERGDSETQNEYENETVIHEGRSTVPVCGLCIIPPPATAFAATGDVGTVTFAYTYDANGNTMYYNSGAEINGYTAGGVGDPKYRMYVDGDTAFCIQPGVPNSSETWNALSDSQKKAVGLALLYGYQGNRDGLTGSDDEKWLATQTLIWEFVTGCRNTSGSFIAEVVLDVVGGNLTAASKGYSNIAIRASGFYDLLDLSQGGALFLFGHHNTLPPLISQPCEKLRAAIIG